MGKITRVTCDGCGVDLTTRTNSVDYRLVLTSESKPGSGPGFYTSVMIYPPVDRTYYFCDLGCLDHWRAHENIKNGLWKAFYDGWRNKYGTEYKSWAGNETCSYPETPEWLRDQANLMFEAAADEAFPLDKKG
jgi:hypothetical protein